MGNSKTLSKVPAQGIRGQVEESLENLEKMVSQERQQYSTLNGQVQAWNKRVERAQKVLARVKPEGREATELLLAQAQEVLKVHQEDFLATSSRLQNFMTYRDELNTALEHLKMADRQEELRKRISGISSAIAIETNGDEKNSAYDMRELERTIHTVKALIEIRGNA